jgi:hypothetical protein
MQLFAPADSVKFYENIQISIRHVSTEILRTRGRVLIIRLLLTSAEKSNCAYIPRKTETTIMNLCMQINELLTSIFFLKNVHCSS